MRGRDSEGAEPLLQVDRLVVKYGVSTAVSDISMSILPGGAVTLLGTNGAGKSSVTRALAGLVPVAGGNIYFDGEDVTDTSAFRRCRSGLGYVPEERGIFRDLSVSDNMRMAVRWLGDKQKRKDGIAYGYHLFPRLAERRNQLAGLLSGGEQEMLSIARALAPKPRLLICDEPSIGLGPQMVDAVFEALQVARADGAAVLLVEQFVHRALEFADQALILRSGRCVWSGCSEAKEEGLQQYLEDSSEELLSQS